jgi:flagellar motor switch protein FliN/FliY
MKNDKLQNSISTSQLLKEYNWYQNTFPSTVQSSCDDFFNPQFDLNLIGISKNINCLQGSESYFVTKIKIDENYEMFFRLTDTAIDVILSTILGQAKQKFNINKITDLETKIITSFNDFMFENLKNLLSEPESVELKRSNFDLIHLTFVIKSKNEEVNGCGKVIITLPLALLKPQAVDVSGVEKFSEDDFPNSETVGNVYIGKTKFSVFDLKNLEKEDVVVFEDSNTEQVMMKIEGEEFTVKLSPNMDILMPEDNNGGDDMGSAHQNIWDSIEVEMIAEVDAVKITLGELKNIESGLVVDLTSLYDNNVTLKVEGKPIATGSLVIVNDRYGVKINDVIANGASSSSPLPASTEATEEGEIETSGEVESQEISEAPASEANSGDEEEFDYSDFELEDENI